MTKETNISHGARERVRAAALHHPKRDEILTVLHTYIADRIPPPSYAAIGARVGVSKSMVAEIITASDLQDDTDLRGALRELRQQKKTEIFTPSRDTAWFLGIITGSGGRIDPTTAKISFESRDDNPALQVFKGVGERLFSTTEQSVEGVIKSQDGHTTVAFYNRNAYQALGDFRIHTRGETLTNKHAWIEDSAYLSSFVSGLVDSLKMEKLPKVARVVFHSTHTETAIFFRDLFIKFGIQNPRILRESKQVFGVQIRDKDDLRFLE